MRAMLLLMSFLSSTAVAQVRHGTPVHLMLLKDISSTSSMIGDPVPFLVTQDVEAHDQVLIPEGTLVFARVSQCRREGALSAPLFDKPARLFIHFQHLRDIGGNDVEVCPKPGQDRDLQVVREMTVRKTSGESREIESALRSPATRPLMEKMHRLFNDAAVTLTEKEAEVLISHNVRMPAVQEAIRTGAFGAVVDFLRDIKHARTLDLMLSLTPVTRPALLAVRAVRELGRLSGGIGDYFEGRFKGRNIRCSAGVEFTVYTG